MPLKVKTQVKVKGDFVLPEGSPPFKGQVKGHFVLPEGSPSRAGSRPGPAPALSGKHNCPLRGCPQQKPFPDGPGAIRSELNAPSRRIPAARPGKHFSLGVCDASSRSKPRTRSKAISFCLKAGRLLRARSKTISFCLKAARAGPAVAPALHPRYPANTTARCAGTLSKSVFLTDQARFAPGSTHLLAASLRLVLENTFPSAFVMPPQGQNPGQNRKDKR
jgi:hypothetical protein